MTPEERVLRARLAAHTRWANCEDRRAALAPAREGFERKFEDQVDPERKLSATERAKRAESARKAHMAKMALNRAQARRLRSGRRKS
jgi:hypothetical protein